MKSKLCQLWYGKGYKEEGICGYQVNYGYIQPITQHSLDSFQIIRVSKSNEQSLQILICIKNRRRFKELRMGLDPHFRVNSMRQGNCWEWDQRERPIKKFYVIPQYCFFEHGRNFEIPKKFVAKQLLNSWRFAFEYESRFYLSLS